MKRRDILKLICGSTIAWPQISNAQQNRSSDSAARVEAPAAVPLLAPFLPGVNLAVGEFNEEAKYGGKLWTNYGYPDPAEIDYYASKGFRLVRIPFLAKRVLSASYKPTADMDVLLRLIDHADHRRVAVVLDMHDYGMSRSGRLIGRDAGATREFAACWAAIAERIKGEHNVALGLMNEPHDQTAREWLSGANAAIKAIRSAGAGQLLLVPGSYWDGAWKWTEEDNHTVMLGVIDPLDNYAYEAHQYFDADGSGNPGDPVIAGSGASRPKPFTEWLRANGKKGFIGEFSFTSSPAYLAEADAFLKHISENRDVYIGFAVWAGGPWWGDYPFSVEPDLAATPVIDKPQMRVLANYLR
ncbi:MULTISPECIES: glycoside hydrolase family 5 protein [unclassified Bradyrhizobium]|uniref:glycoside hydrolase family 5 protein n=1 Tax=unclassified Bradyrhizobium TaxID=2631580 RepID=UPI002478DC5E|nr:MULTISPECIES: glycoside hydrolase family 5 protein [unclassified Bradyrhizobium]WGR68656.1 glycoside hydrolase family 5 protein [Bradyrhizobium sp. ISRA426]WGR80711.1 glycoside hydrolase family 5 protein [Bradyrhizobium sp. ISRA430]WGR83896.1 glycoside hydrolase family 5 protein [Bradyrhizobium sp. ISRA432]